MKLIIQLPCFNEEQTLPEAIAGLPRELPGFDEVEFLVIDDGSTDKTSAIAKSLGVNHVVRFAQNRGLARAFMAGIDACLRMGADVIVNTDADNQYDPSCIADLVKPILEGTADMVVGDRQVGTVSSFSTTKKHLQKLGSWIVRKASGAEVPDATSGFRAISKDAALGLFVTNEFTYTLETIIQAGSARMKIDAVPIRTNPPTRESRLFKSMWGYIKRSLVTIIRIYTMYNPLKTFLTLSLIFLIGGLVVGGRFLYYFVMNDGAAGHVQSLILAAILILASFQIALSGIVADLVGANRKILESILKRVRRLETDQHK